MANISNLLLRYRRVGVVLAHIVIWLAAYAGAFLLRFDFEVPHNFRTTAHFAWAAPLVGLRLYFFAREGLFVGMWRYTGQRDLEGIARAISLSTAVFALAVLITNPKLLPRSVYLVEPMLSGMMVAGLRLSARWIAQTARRIDTADKRRVLIAGAGDAGEALIREMRRSMPSVHPAGIVDDAPEKQGMSIHGVPVLGTILESRRLIAVHDVAEVIIAIPTATGSDMRRIIDEVSADGVKVRTVPGMDHLIDGRVTVQQIRNVAIEDLLGRAPVTLDNDRLSNMIGNEVVMVTGAGGSIGSELCRQAARFNPQTLVLVEQSENALYQIHRELKGRHPDLGLLPRIADICDVQRTHEVMGETKPSFVLHAAAHKHVPMMEWNPGEAVKNNVGGTRSLADAAHAHDVKCFVMISTDKAVHPTSVMGCTKRVAELYVQSRAATSNTRFVTVRFGNVLGSNGSVIPLFKEQIRKGGPVTVTHPDMVRYFMTIPEASQLVLQASTFGGSGEIYVLDMGDPVKIVALAEDLIRLSGFVPGRDIDIEFTGMRPGEKLFEELSVDAENARKTTHPKIFVGKTTVREASTLENDIDRLLEEAISDRPGAIREQLKAIVPSYTGVTTGP